MQTDSKNTCADKRRKVMVFGTFDILHAGHLNMFRQAKQYGDYLIVSVARNHNIKSIKGSSPLHSEEDRLAGVQSAELVDKCFLGEIEDPFLVIKREKPDIIALGYDQVHKFSKKLPGKLKEIGLEQIKIVKLEAYKPEIYKSSKLKAKP